MRGSSVACYTTRRLAPDARVGLSITASANFQPTCNTMGLPSPPFHSVHHAPPIRIRSLRQPRFLLRSLCMKPPQPWERVKAPIWRPFGAHSAPLLCNASSMKLCHDPIRSTPKPSQPSQPDEHEQHQLQDVPSADIIDCTDEYGGGR